MSTLTHLGHLAMTIMTCFWVTLGYIWSLRVLYQRYETSNCRLLRSYYLHVQGWRARLQQTRLVITISMYLLFGAAFTITWLGIILSQWGIMP